MLILFSSPQTVEQAKLDFFVYDGPYQPTLIFVSKAAANRVQIFIRSETRVKRLSRESKRRFFGAIYSIIGINSLATDKGYAKIGVNTQSGNTKRGK